LKKKKIKKKGGEKNEKERRKKKIKKKGGEKNVEREKEWIYID